jgi:NAD(P)-dependent dehydrogenase (short-subunit alcohol dehydrogenase family)
MENLLALTDKVALVTGSSSGIGAATVTLFARLGARVAIGYHNNRKGAELVQGQILSAAGEAILCQADVSRAGEIDSLVLRLIPPSGPNQMLRPNPAPVLLRKIACICSFVRLLRLKVTCSRTTIRPCDQKRAFEYLCAFLA